MSCHRLASSGFIPTRNCSSACAKNGNNRASFHRLPRSRAVFCFADRKGGGWAARHDLPGTQFPPALVAGRDQCAGPEANILGHKLAWALFEARLLPPRLYRRRIVAGELRSLRAPATSKKKGIAAPAREEAGSRRPASPCITPVRDWTPSTINMAVILRRHSLCAHQRGGASPSASHPWRTRSATGT